MTASPPGFMPADVPEMGSQIICITDGDQAKADATAQALGMEVFGMRGQVRPPPIPPAAHPLCPPPHSPSALHHSSPPPPALLPLAGGRLCC